MPGLSFAAGGNMNGSWAHVNSENYLVNSSATIILSPEIVFLIGQGDFYPMHIDWYLAMNLSAVLCL